MKITTWIFLINVAFIHKIFIYNIFRKNAIDENTLDMICEWKIPFFFIFAAIPNNRIFYLLKECIVTVEIIESTKSLRPLRSHQHQINQFLFDHRKFEPWQFNNRTVQIFRLIFHPLTGPTEHEQFRNVHHEIVHQQQHLGSFHLSPVHCD